MQQRRSVQRLSQGHVVDVNIADPNGQNRKPRPVVILTKTNELADVDEFLAAAISTKFDEPLPAHYIRVPWSADGRARSGLTEPSVVKCFWLVSVKRENVISIRGHLSDTVVRDIMRVVTQG